MNNYFDKYGRLHDKPVTELNPIPCNNSWLYTAYYVKMGGRVEKTSLWACYQLCFESEPVLHVTRSPGKKLPPMSRDEILGLISLEIPSVPRTNTWNFSPFPIPKFNLITLVKQLWQLRPEYKLKPWDGDVTNPEKYGWEFKHRNYFWQNNLDQLYRFAFSVPYTDRHFILQKQGKFNLVYWAIAKVDSLIGKDSGIRYLKYVKSEAAMKTEFPEDHPIRNLK